MRKSRIAKLCRLTFLNHENRLDTSWCLSHSSVAKDIESNKMFKWGVKPIRTDQESRLHRSPPVPLCSSQAHRYSSNAIDSLIRVGFFFFTKVKIVSISALDSPSRKKMSKAQLHEPLE
jgi:hypothetical protein